MHFPDLTSQTASFTSDPERFAELQCEGVLHRKVNDSPNYAWTLILVCETEGLPVLPAAFREDRTRILRAMEGGVEFTASLKKFRIPGQVQLASLVNDQPAWLDVLPGQVHGASLRAAEGFARLTYRVTVAAPVDPWAVALIGLTDATVRLSFTPTPAQEQLALFAGVLPEEP